MGIVKVAPLRANGSKTYRLYEKMEGKNDGK